MTLSSSPPATGDAAADADADADAESDGDIDSATLGAAELGAALGAAALELPPPLEHAANSTAVTPSIERRPRMDIGSSFATGLLGVGTRTVGGIMPAVADRGASGGHAPPRRSRAVRRRRAIVPGRDVLLLDLVGPLPSGKQPPERVLVDDDHPEVRRFRQLRPGALARDQVVGLLRHRSGPLAARGPHGVLGPL